MAKYGSKLLNSLQSLEIELLTTKPNMEKVMSLLPDVCNNTSKITINDLKSLPNLIKFIGSDDNNTIDGNSTYNRGIFRTAKTINECKQNLRNLLKSPKDGGLPIDANTWNNNPQIKEIIEKQTNQNLAYAMTNLNMEFKFETEAYPDTVQRNDEGSSPEINIIKAENNINPRIALLLSGNPTKERMKPYYENMGIKDKIFYGQAWLNIKRACNLNKVGKSNVFACGERFKEILALPEVEIIIIKFEISQIEKEMNVLQKKKDEIDTIHANVNDLPGIIKKVNLEKHENYEAESTNLKKMLEFNINRQKELIADSSIPSSDALLEQINTLKTELDKLRSEETILLDNFNSSTTDPTINVGSQLPLTTSAGGGRKKFSLRRHIFGHQITRRKRISKRSFKKKKKASRRTRKKCFF